MEQKDQSFPVIPLLLGGILIVLLIVAALFLPKGKEIAYQKNPEATTTPANTLLVVPPQAPEVIPVATSTKDLEPTITRISPSPVANGTVIEGSAPGPWFFEASFPIELRDNTGTLIATAIAQADADWMTTEAVPFHATLHFAPPTSASGTLIFKKDNPSGLPEHDKSVTRAVSILTAKKSGKDSTFYLGFISEKDAANKDCTKILSSVRVVPQTPAIATEALTALLEGPTIGDIGDGMLTIIPSGVKLNAVVIKNGVATADFNSKLTEGVAGSCKVGAIRAQIEETLKQFPTVTDVVISVNGKSEGILQP